MRKNALKRTHFSNIWPAHYLLFVVDKTAKRYSMFFITCSYKPRIVHHGLNGFCSIAAFQVIFFFLEAKKFGLLFA